MTPAMLKKLPRENGDGEVWDVGGGYCLLVLPEDEISYVCAYRAKDRAQHDWLTDEIEAVAKKNELWLETAPSIDIMMVVVRSADVPAFLQACADRFSGSRET